MANWIVDHSVLILSIAVCICVVLLLSTGLINFAIRKYRDALVPAIIDGNYKTLSLDIAEKNKKEFVEWRKFENSMYAQAKFGLKDSLKKHLINPFSVECSSKPPDKEFGPATLLVENAFTEPFPSFHDADDQALHEQIMNIILLSWFDPTDSPKFFVHQKEHFVNHGIAQAIIKFDLYKKD